MPFLSAEKVWRRKNEIRRKNIHLKKIVPKKDRKIIQESERIKNQEEKKEENLRILESESNSLTHSSFHSLLSLLSLSLEWESLTLPTWNNQSGSHSLVSFLLFLSFQVHFFSHCLFCCFLLLNSFSLNLFSLIQLLLLTSLFRFSSEEEKEERTRNTREEKRTKISVKRTFGGGKKKEERRRKVTLNPANLFLPSLPHYFQQVSAKNTKEKEEKEITCSFVCWLTCEENWP